MKLWHDDVRRPPDGWTWVRTNNEAKEQLQTGNVDTISLDHDMGFHNLDPDNLGPYDHVTLRGTSDDNGMRLVEWMVENEIVPKTVLIHSWNTDGAKRMYLYLNEHGYDCTYEAYTP